MVKPISIISKRRWEKIVKCRKTRAARMYHTCQGGGLHFSQTFTKTINKQKAICSKNIMLLLSFFPQKQLPWEYCRPRIMDD
jgi:hypothetical protein